MPPTVARLAAWTLPRYWRGVFTTLIMENAEKWMGVVSPTSARAHVSVILPSSSAAVMWLACVAHTSTSRLGHTKWAPTLTGSSASLTESDHVPGSMLA